MLGVFLSLLGPLALAVPHLPAQTGQLEAGRPAPPRLPDVVLFVIDDVADSDLDSIATPTLDAMAERGVRYRRAYSQAWCSPTRDSLMRSVWLGSDHGDGCAPATARTLVPGEFNLPRLFEGQGYRTATFGKWHLGSNPLGPWELTPQLMGFDAARASYPVGDCGPATGWIRVDDGVVSTSRGDRMLPLRDAFLQWWAETDSPRFAVVNFTAAHEPFNFPPRTALPPNYPRPLSPTNRQTFAAEVASADYLMGQMLSVLGPDDWAFFLGDNGTPGRVPGQAPSQTDATRPDQDPGRVKLTCYEDGVRVPLIVQGPNLSPGTESRALVHVVDILPTLAEILHAPLRAPVDGRSFAGTLTGGPGRRDYVYVQSLPRVDDALILERWKLLTNPDGAEEFYDLERDPREQTPLPLVGPVVEKLRLLRGRLQLGRR